MPVSTAPTKRRNAIQEEEPDKKKVILGDMANEESGDMTAADISALNARRRRREDCLHGGHGKNLHEIYSNERITLAVDRQSAELLMSVLSAQTLVNAAPEAGVSLTGAIGGQEEPGAIASVEGDDPLAGVVGGSKLAVGEDVREAWTRTGHGHGHQERL